MILNLLKRITKSLEIKNIPYMLSGSIALNNYTVPRMTMDIDIIIELHEENLNDFLSIFGDNYYLNRDVVKVETKRLGMFNVIDHETGFKVDFILRKNTEYRKHEFQRRKKTQIADFEVWIVSPEDLTISKIEWVQQYQSDKQINDIENLLANPEIDKIYITSWCEKLSLKTFNLI
ncbi:MAG: hypothetical protein DRJ10_01625 [Bacteroidetes bacterium]|nr:MAG: hypothetical protein DRJ10_01625 [Bacteroidota bacterium]